MVGEDADRYWGYVIAIFQCVQPNDFVDFIYQRDLIDLEWDVLRYRTAKAQLVTNAKDEPFAIDVFNDAANQAAALTARVMAPLIPKLRQIDLMIESAEMRRDRAYRELERRRASLAKQLRDAVKQQAAVEAANDEVAQKAA